MVIDRARSVAWVGAPLMKMNMVMLRPVSGSLGFVLAIAGYLQELGINETKFGIALPLEGRHDDRVANVHQNDDLLHRGGRSPTDDEDELTGRDAGRGVLRLGVDVVGHRVGYGRRGGRGDEASADDFAGEEIVDRIPQRALLVGGVRTVDEARDTGAD